MQILLLAAGAGRRMKHLSNDRPKALVVVDGRRSILEINLDHAFSVLPEAQVTVCGGYRHDRLVSFVEQHPQRERIATVFNPSFLTEGPLRSIATALATMKREHTQTGLVIANGDTVFAAPLFAAVSRSGPGASLAVSKDDLPEPDDMVVGLDREGRVASVSKLVAGGEPGVVSAGFLAVKGAATSRDLQEALAEALEAEARSGRLLPWHSMVGHLARREPLAACFVERGWWHEFDSPECIKRFRDTGATAAMLQHRLPLDRTPAPD